jgi:hypothetical protein
MYSSGVTDVQQWRYRCTAEHYLIPKGKDLKNPIVLPS